MLGWWNDPWLGFRSGIGGVFTFLIQMLELLGTEKTSCSWIPWPLPFASWHLRDTLYLIVVSGEWRCMNDGSAISLAWKRELSLCYKCSMLSAGGSLVTKSCPALVTPWTAAYQAPLSMGFSRQEYWSGVPLPSPPVQFLGWEVPLEQG